MIGLIYVAEAACCWPECDAYAEVSWATTKRLASRARRELNALGWSVTRVGGRTIVRCPDHRGKRMVEP